MLYGAACDDGSTRRGAEYQADIPSDPLRAVGLRPLLRRNHISYHRVRGGHVKRANKGVRKGDREQGDEIEGEPIHEYRDRHQTQADEKDGPPSDLVCEHAAEYRSGYARKSIAHQHDTRGRIRDLDISSHINRQIRNYEAKSHVLDQGARYEHLESPGICPESFEHHLSTWPEEIVEIVIHWGPMD